MIRDLGSRNGTYLNGKRVEEELIQAGDSIRIGPLAFMFQVEGQPAPASQQQSGKVKLSREDLPADDTASPAGDDEFSSAIELDDAEGSDEDNFELPDDIV
jgi:pSer/pThr/pTyr-binding forkhead associated (FHA) protein